MIILRVGSTAVTILWWRNWHTNSLFLSRTKIPMAGKWLSQDIDSRQSKSSTHALTQAMHSLQESKSSPPPTLSFPSLYFPLILSIFPPFLSPFYSFLLCLSLLTFIGLETLDKFLSYRWTPLSPPFLWNRLTCLDTSIFQNSGWEVWRLIPI